MAAAAPSSDRLAEELLALTRALTTPEPAAVAALRQHLQRIRSLSADQQQSVCCARNSAGRSALHHSCAVGAAWAVRELLPMGAVGILGAQDGQGQTALHLALQTATDLRKGGSDAQGALQCAHLLLEQEEQARQSAGASSSSAAAASSSASGSASRSDAPAAKRARVSDELMDGAMASAAPAITAAAALPSQPSLLSLPDSFDRLPLHWAVACGDESVLLRCLAAGAASAFVNAQTRSGDTPLHWACADDRLNAVDLLLSSGADPSLKNARDETPLDLCTSDQTRSVVQLWLSKREAAAAAAPAALDHTVSASALASSRLASQQQSKGSSAGAKKKITIKLKK
jgi:ankyrin repeat protein